VLICACLILASGSRTGCRPWRTTHRHHRRHCPTSNNTTRSTPRRSLRITKSNQGNSPRCSTPVSTLHRIPRSSQSLRLNATTRNCRIWRRSCPNMPRSKIRSVTKRSRHPSRSNSRACPMLNQRRTRALLKHPNSYQPKRLRGLTDYARLVILVVFGK